MTDPRTFGIDDGYFKGPVKGHNYAVLKASPKNPEFILFCFGSGLWIEPEAEWLVEQADKHGWKWGAWYFPYRHLEPQAQLDLWLTQPKGDFPAQVDFEFSRSKKTIVTAAQLKTLVEGFEAEEKREGMVYSRKNLIDAHLQSLSATWLNKRWWWLAQYLNMQELRGEHPGPVDLPARLMRERVIIHQTADRLPPPPGFTLAAKSMDHDRWCGVMTLEEFTGIAPAPTVEERLSALERLAHAH